MYAGELRWLQAWPGWDQGWGMLVLAGGPPGSGIKSQLPFRREARGSAPTEPPPSPKLPMGPRDLPIPPGPPLPGMLWRGSSTRTLWSASLGLAVGQGVAAAGSTRHGPEPSRERQRRTETS